MDVRYRVEDGVAVFDESSSWTVGSYLYDEADLQSEIVRDEDEYVVTTYRLDNDVYVHTWDGGMEKVTCSPEAAQRMTALVATWVNPHQ